MRNAVLNDDQCRDKSIRVDKKCRSPTSHGNEISICRFVDRCLEIQEASPIEAVSAHLLDNEESSFGFHILARHQFDGVYEN